METIIIRQRATIFPFTREDSPSYNFHDIHNIAGSETVILEPLSRLADGNVKRKASRETGSCAQDGVPSVILMAGSIWHVRV